MDSDKVRLEMEKAVVALKKDLSSMRTGRATPGMIENLVVNVYGGAQRLKVMELASVSVPDPQTLVIDPWDKSIVGEIRQGIIVANLGFHPSIDGEIIRISLPIMTREDRERSVKLLHTKLEHAKITIRQIRGDIMKGIKQQFETKEISEDERFSQEKALQGITDQFVDTIEKLGASKEEELLQI